MTQPPVGVLCDMDGTLVDTEPYWEQAKIRVAHDHGIPFTSEDARVLVGKSMGVTVKAMQDAGVPLSNDDIIAELLADMQILLDQHIPWLPGAEAFLERMAAAHIPVCLVTQAYSEVAQVIVDHAPAGAFHGMVAGDHFQNPKPHPDPYLLGMERLHLMPNQCVAFEDTPAGAASAHAAGVPVMVITGDRRSVV